MSFTIATLNVHMWVDANHDDNIDRIVQLVKVNLTFGLLYFFTYPHAPYLPLKERDTAF